MRRSAGEDPGNHSMAKRFQFRLEAVLKVRRQRRDHCRRLFAEQLRHVQQQERRLVDLHEQVRTESRARRSDALQAELDMSLLRSRQYYVGHLQRTIEGQEVELEGLQRELEERRETLVGASRELKVIEKLRERQWERHGKAASRRETIEADESSVDLFRRYSEMDFAVHGSG